MLPTDPYDPAMQDIGPADPNAYETRGWGQSAPFPYAPEQGAGAAMPQPGRPPADGVARLIQSVTPQGHGDMPPPAESLMAAALQRQMGPDYMPPPASVGTALGYQEDLQRRNRGRMPRPDPLRAAALIELGKLMAENGRTMKQHHSLLEAFHALQGPSAQQPLD